MSVVQGNVAATCSPARNVELKAKDSDRARSVAACGHIGAEPQGALLQCDTYFQARRGRLKLREQEGARPHLIAYERPDVVEARESQYRIIEIGEPEKLKEGLQATLGVRAVVAKERLLFLWEGVRIHLDRVADLGDFIEFEADLVAGSSCDMVSPRAG